MDSMMTCPLCGGMHPEGTTFCDIMWGEIPQESRDDLAAEEADLRLQSDTSEHEEVGRCPSCGAFGTPGEECWQCGSVIEPADGEGRRRRVVLRLDDGPIAALEPDKTIVIGRESEAREISDMLASYDVVSRRHCAIRVSQDATMVTITDCGSTNGTFVGPDAERLNRDVACTAKLPVRIRLGSCVGITLDLEG